MGFESHPIPLGALISAHRPSLQGNSHFIGFLAYSMVYSNKSKVGIST